MINKTIETNVVIAEKEELFFKEVVFDFDSLPAQSGYFGQSPNIASRLFLVQNVDESIEVKPYPTRESAIMFNAWITKNISYKVAEQRPKEYNPTPIITGSENLQQGQLIPPVYSSEMVGIGMKDAAGYPTVYGPLYHMTKVIDFGGIIKIDLPDGEKLRDTDIVEVVSAEVVSSHDELLNPEPIYDVYPVITTTYQEIEIPLPSDPFKPDEPPKTIKFTVPQQVLENKYRQFDPPLTQYARLREKMCIKIKVRILRKESVDIDFQQSLDEK